MKSTDFAPRTAPLEVYLMGRLNLTGIEIGVDAGAHAESLLTYLSIEKLILVDIWENKWVKGFCEGRLSKFKTKTEFILNYSHLCALKFNRNQHKFDFIYVDITHDEQTVKESLYDWFFLLNDNGVMAYRNYTTCQKAIDEFIQAHLIRTEIDSYANEIILFK